MLALAPRPLIRTSYRRRRRRHSPLVGAGAAISGVDDGSSGGSGATFPGPLTPILLNA